MTPASSLGPHHTVTVVAAGADRVHAEAAWASIRRAWPEYARPASGAVMSCAEASRLDGVLLGGVLVVAGPDLGAEVFVLLDRLRMFDVPAVLLSVDYEAALQRAGGRGVLVRPLAADPGEVAAALHALLERQRDVEAIREELRIARRFQGGIRSEMERMHDELQLAASVQRDFLPRSMPDVPGVAFHVFYRPCDYVSGDIYDVMRLDEHHVGFFLADAAGHGVPAALMTMVMARALVTTRTRGERVEIVPPSEVLTALNHEMIRRRGAVPRFATGVYGVIDCRDLRMTLAAAGHPPPLILGQDGRTPAPLPTEGALLGVFEDAEFREVSVRLAPDAMLLIYSDGFETAFPEPGRTGPAPNENYVARFARLAEFWGENGIDEAMQGLGVQLDAQSGSLHQIDDLTAMAIVPKGEAGAGRLGEAA